MFRSYVGGITSGLLSKYTFLRLKVAYELRSNFQNFNFHEIIKMIVSCYIIHNNDFDKPGIKANYM